MKIQFKLPKSDIVVFDDVNKEILINSILQDFDYYILETRGKSLILHYCVMYEILIHTFKIFKKRKLINKLREIKKIYFISIINYISPKVLITFIDNDPYFHAVCRECKNITGVAIQNGVRTHYNFNDKLNKEFQDNYYIPYYFVLGNHAESLYKKYSHECKDIFVIGSIKLDYFLSKQKATEDYKYQLCLISTWAGGEKITGDYPFSTENQYEVLLKIKNIVIKYGYSLVIALKTNEMSEESYYRDIFADNAIYKIDIEDPFSAYSICTKSEIILTTYSTLGFEFFATGKKVIFFNLSGDDRYTHSISNTITSLQNSTLFDLISKMLIEDRSYEYRTLNDVQCVQNKKSSFEVVKEFISKVLN